MPQAEALTLAAIDALYREIDLPGPSPQFPVAPLGPITERLLVRVDEVPNLTFRTAEAFLSRRNVLREPLPTDGDNPDARLSGFIYSDGRVARILLDAGEIVTRRRFSLAHELGHFVLHCRTEARGETPPNDTPFVDALDLDAPGFDAREREADSFAAHLLMPEPIVRAVIDEAIADGWPIESTWREVAERCFVSYQAARRRLRDLEIPLTPGNIDESPKEGDIFSA